jgi:AbrB family looped-hinge helix DNA binding protein
MVSYSKLTSKGQVTLPKQVRDQLNLQTGDRLAFQIGENGDVLLTRDAPRPFPFVGRLRHLAGARPATIEEMNAAVADAVRERLERAGR